MTDKRLSQHGNEGFSNIVLYTMTKKWDSKKKESFLENIANIILLNDICNYLVYSNKISEQRNY